MQAVTIFFPIFEAYKSKQQMRKTLDIIRTWEEKKLGDESTLSSGSTKHNSFFSAKKPASASTTMSRSSREMYTMAALEKALVMNPIPLLQFAATKDFTGENIVFLIQVRDWHAAWNRAPRYINEVTAKAKAQLFGKAIEIYASSIYNKTAEFPINIEHKVRADLDAVFGVAVADMKPRFSDNVVDPFNDKSIELETTKGFRRPLEREVSSDSGPTLWESQESILPSTKEFIFEPHPCVQPIELAIPGGFNEKVFDAAERSIKYLVVTNTWQKFVESHKDWNAVSP